MNDVLRHKPRKGWQHEKESARPPHKQACLAGRWRALTGRAREAPGPPIPFLYFLMGPLIFLTFLLAFFSLGL